MSKPIKLSPEDIEKCVEEFREKLTNTKMCNGSLKYEKSFSSSDNKATLYFTETAWAKMYLLVQMWDKEIGWHGVAARYGEDDNSYIITDIVVYPQEVTGATIDTDQAKYEEWMMNLDDDTFNNLRFHGHSHVNMGTSPSSTDLEHQAGIVDALSGDTFYIFMIINKRNEKNIKIYDFKKNIMFENADIICRPFTDGSGLFDTIETAKDVVKERKYTTPAYKKDDEKTSKYTPATTKSNSKTGKSNASYGYGAYGGTYYNQSYKYASYDYPGWDD